MKFSVGQTVWITLNSRSTRSRGYGVILEVDQTDHILPYRIECAGRITWYYPSEVEDFFTHECRAALNS